MSNAGNPWFRFYSAAMRHPKVLKLTDKEFRLWVQLLSIASENDGLIPPLDDLKRLLKARLDHLLTGVERLLSIGLIDALDVGYSPRNWNKRQYKSDSSKERVEKHRKKCNVTVTPPDTDTDTDTDKDIEISSLHSDISAKNLPEISEKNEIEKPKINEPKKPPKPKKLPELPDEAILERLSPWVQGELAAAFIAKRRDLKCSHSEMAVKLLCGELAKCRDPTACVEKAILHEWKTVYPERDQQRSPSGYQSQPKKRGSAGLVQALDEMYKNDTTIIQHHHDSGFNQGAFPRLSIAG